MNATAKTQGHLKIRALAEAGIFIAMAQLLSYVKLYESPYGGSVTAAAMLPILLFAVRWGSKWGTGAAVVYGALQFLLGSMYPAPFTSKILAYGAVIVLDYLVAYGVLGLAGLFKSYRWGLVLGSAVGISARFAVHLVSGVLLWYEYAEDMPVWLYSLVYNGTYLGPELGICVALSLVLLLPLEPYITGRDLQK